MTNFSRLRCNRSNTGYEIGVPTAFVDLAHRFAKDTPIDLANRKPLDDAWSLALVSLCFLVSQVIAAPPTALSLELALNLFARVEDPQGNGLVVLDAVTVFNSLGPFLWHKLASYFAPFS